MRISRLFFLPLLGCTNNAPLDVTVSVVESYFATMDDHFDADNEGRVAIGIFLEGNGTLYEDTYVISNDETEVADIDTVFQIGSITKTFTAAVMAQKAADGSMVLTDPAQDYLPPIGGAIPGPVLPDTFGGKPVTITLEQLISHHSGFSRNLPDDAGSTPYLHAFDVADDETLLFAPGDACYSYSNWAFGVAGLALSYQEYPKDTAYYDQYEQVIVDNLVGPLGMSDTRITLSADQESRLAIGYNASRDEADYELSTWPMNHAGGGLYSTISDMMIYGREMAGEGALLSASEITDMQTTRTRLWRKMCQAKKSRHSGWQGLGWVRNDDLVDPVSGDELSRYTKNGETGGFHSMISYSTPTIDGHPYRAVVVLLANKKDYPLDGVPDVMQQMFDEEFAP